MPTISAVVATFGDRAKWDALAERAIGSLEAQTVKPLAIHRVHDETLARARNAGAERATGEWLLFVDADDCVDQRYIEAMSDAILDEGKFHWDHEMLLQPATSAWFPDGTTDENPTIIPKRGPTMSFGNHLVIGSLIRRELYWKTGGFQEWPALEDWAMFMRAVDLGAVTVPVPAAIYYVFQTPNGRNANPPRNIYSDIMRAHEKWRAEQGIESP